MGETEITVSRWEELFEAALDGAAAGRVLDVCTGQGGLLGPLLAKQPGAALILGIDLHMPSLDAARELVDQPAIQLAAMDGERLALPAASFDLAVIGVSLHHLERPRVVLDDMKRILRTLGRLVVIEMHSDGETEPQRVMADLHSWFAWLDRARGMVHDAVWSRKEVIRLVEALNLEQVATVDFRPGAELGHGEEIADQLEAAMDRALERVADHLEHGAFREAGDLLRGRLRRYGTAPEPMVALTGRKASGTP